MMSEKVFHITSSLFTEDRGAIPTAAQSLVDDFSQSYVSKVKTLESVIKKLRIEDLNRGYCFMIFDENLPDGHAYYEYPDSCIQIEIVDNRNLESPRTILKVLTKSEAIAVRKRHDLFP